MQLKKYLEGKLEPGFHILGKNKSLTQSFKFLTQKLTEEQPNKREDKK